LCHADDPWITFNRIKFNTGRAICDLTQGARTHGPYTPRMKFPVAPKHARPRNREK